MPMDSLFPDYVFPIPGPAWTRGSEPLAGVFLLDGACHIVAHHSPAAHRLMELGALLVANVRFDRDPLESSHPHRPVRSLGLREMVERFLDDAPPDRAPLPGPRGRLADLEP